MRFLAILTCLAAILGASDACAWRGGPVATPGAGGVLLARQFSGYPQSNAFFPLGVNFVLSNRAGDPTQDNITAICALPASFRAACGNGGVPLTSYPVIPLTNIPAPCSNAGAPTTISFPTGTNISGAANMGANTIEIISGNGPIGGDNKWPEGVGCDYGEMLQAQLEGMYVIAGGPPETGYPATGGVEDVSTAVLPSGTTTGASCSPCGLGGTATITFTPPTKVPVGHEVTVLGVSPSGYNTSAAVVTASSPGVVSYKSNGAGGTYTVAGTITSSLHDTVASQIDVAKAAYNAVTGKTGAPNLIGHFVIDEPGCGPGNKTIVDSIAANANIAYWDAVDSAIKGVGPRPTLTNQFGAWIAYMPTDGGPTRKAANGNVFPCAGSPAVCPTLADGTVMPNFSNWPVLDQSCLYKLSGVVADNPMFIRGLQDSAVAISDDYANINVSNGVSTLAIYAAPGDGVYPNDRMWIEPLITTNTATLKCPANGVGRGSTGGPMVKNGLVDNCKTHNAQPLWTFLEAATDGGGGGQGSPTLFNASYDPNGPGSDPTHTLNYVTSQCAIKSQCPYFGVTSAPGCSPVPSANCSGWVGLGVTDASAYVEVIDATGSGARVTANIDTDPAGAGCPIVTIKGVPTQTFNCINSYTVNTPGSGYTAPFIKIIATGGGKGATASVALGSGGTAGQIAAVNSTAVGQDYAGGSGCIPYGTTITAIPAGPHSLTATISNALTCAAVNEGVAVISNPDLVAYTGGVRTCRYTLATIEQNNCPTTGQRLRSTKQDITAEAWDSIIAGSTGIFWFQQDSCSGGWGYGGNSGSACLGDGNPTGTAAGDDFSSQAAANYSLKALQYVNLLVTKYAAQINAPVLGQCSVEYSFIAGTPKPPGLLVPGAPTFQVDNASLPTCSNGSLTFHSSSKSFPGEALLTQPAGGSGFYGGAGAAYLFVSATRCSEQNCFCPQHPGQDACQPAGTWDNRASSDLTGANHTFTITAAGFSGKVATVVYDSACDFSHTTCTENNTYTFNGSNQIADIFGDGDDGTNYQVKIYKIQ